MPKKFLVFKTLLGTGQQWVFILCLEYYLESMSKVCLISVTPDAEKLSGMLLG
ncbi:MAG: hypothetical protein CM15mV28_1660 [Thaumasvirus sp.]|nr:MAG: hypothetical protein CM15mV28_1660 [Thaumasvirus sp.]